MQGLSDNFKDNNNADGDRRRKKPVQFEPGMLVWMVSHVKAQPGAKPKLQPGFRGPYVVIGMVSDVAVRVRPVGSADAKVTVHADQVKPYKLGVKQVARLSDASRDDLVDRVGDETPDTSPEAQWEVQKITDHKFSKGKLMFQVQWAGDYAPTWENEADLSCHNLVQEYFQAKCSHP